MKLFKMTLTVILMYIISPLLEMPHRKNERKTKKELRDSGVSLEKSI